MSIVLDGTTGVTAPALTGPIDAANLTGVLPAIDGSALTSINAVNLTGALPAIDGSALTGLSTTNPLTLGTAIASTSGTAIDLTGIPSWAKRVTLMFNGVSFSANPGRVTVTLGTSAGFETTGYISSTFTCYSTTVLQSLFVDAIHLTVPYSFTTGTYFSGQIVLSNLTGNTWTVHGSSATSGDYSYFNANSGTKTLSGILSRLRISSNNVRTFDAGTINISYEG